MEERYCSICGNLLDEDEIDICDNCKASIISNDDIPPTF
jgi:RNA polymerase subunit RPABC4/transcription elongation factor Spt4